MITKFSVLYVGFTELDNVGLGGTPPDERHLSNEQIVKAYKMSLDVAQHMDKLGFDTLWGAEHHFQREGYEVIPNLILWGTYLAARTERLKLGCAFNVSPVWHPIRLAEDFAMADILTDGRVIFGVGRGYQTREVETMGAPLLDQDANRELFEEQMEVMMKAFHQDSFSHHGKHYTIPAPTKFRGYEPTEVTLVPRPIHQPVEVWQAIASGRSIPYMAQNGIKGMITQNADRLARQIFHTYQDEAAKAGRNLALGEDLCLGVAMSIAPTPEEAMENVRPYHDEAYKWFAPFGFVRYVDEDGRPWGTPRRAREGADDRGRHQTTRMALRPAGAGHPRVEGVRGRVPRPRPGDVPLAGGDARGAVQRAALALRGARHAGVRQGLRGRE